MIQNVSFQRKVMYLGLIFLLLIPLYMLGSPATGDPTTAAATPGGKLAQLRAEYDLSEAELGEIDPAGESLKLATMGMRGVAAMLLWMKAHEYKKTEQFENLVATVRQISKLQPHFPSVWEYQSHNLTYNVSVEQDDYRFRYKWVKRGIEYLIEGTRYNRREPKLIHTVGWYIGQKIGRADEHRQFRTLFAEDNDYHAILDNYVPVDTEGRGADGDPDNWLVSKLWYDRAYGVVDNQGIPIRGKAPHIVYVDGPKALINYADAIEDEGYLDEKAEFAWRDALSAMNVYGQRLVPTTWGELIRLNDREAKMAEAERLAEQLDELVPDVRQQLYDERFQTLTELEKEALPIPFTEITSEELWMAKSAAEGKLEIGLEEIAARADPAVLAQANRLAERAKETLQTADRIDRYRQNVNFDYWVTRCRVEQLPQTVKARRHLYQANQLLDQVLLEESRAEFESAWDEWADILGRNPDLLDVLMAEDLADEVSNYIELLNQMDEQLPADFKLRKLLEIHNLLPDHLRTNQPDGVSPVAEPQP